MPRPRTYPGAVGTDLRLADLPQLIVGARDQVFARRRQRDAQRAHAAYAAAVARRERARRRPQRQLWTRVGAAGGLAAAAVTVPLGIDPRCGPVPALGPGGNHAGTADVRGSGS
jgi:hypothetical protein